MEDHAAIDGLTKILISTSEKGKDISPFLLRRVDNILKAAQAKQTDRRKLHVLIIARVKCRKIIAETRAGWPSKLAKQDVCLLIKAFRDNLTSKCAKSLTY
ncbi:hypothetical protein [Chromobacterium sp. ATCC 53434]|uniref:hypothetical protein n=1 Tax=Chromobacterium sp. (strain ATCC 53434 / SC 14030) TaxID=2059672 RepID=UPI001305335F|nr:hypothetical protein [Chromobacterium sp. ATCC 53434]